MPTSGCRFYANIGPSAETIVAYVRAAWMIIALPGRGRTAPLVGPGVGFGGPAWIGDMLSRPNPTRRRRLCTWYSGAGSGPTPNCPANGFRRGAVHVSTELPSWRTGCASGTRSRRGQSAARGNAAAPRVGPGGGQATMDPPRRAKWQQILHARKRLEPERTLMDRAPSRPTDAALRS